MLLDFEVNVKQCEWKERKKAKKESSNVGKN